ncbi:unnamed protein product, partial [Amoebophrya sp. A120]|eukprot:GSA120T00025115001.1
MSALLLFQTRLQSPSRGEPHDTHFDEHCQFIRMTTSLGCRGRQ